VSDAEIARLHPSVMKAAGRFDGPKVRAQLLRPRLLYGKIVRYAYRPFDIRWLYWEPGTKLLDEKRTEYMAHVFDGNLALVTQQKARRDWSCPQVIRSIGCLDLMDRGAGCFPAYLRDDHDNRSGGVVRRRANLSKSMAGRLDRLGLSVEDLFFHIIAKLHSPLYRHENAGALRLDWPRVPLSDSLSGVKSSAMLGRKVAALLDPAEPIMGITAGKLRAEIRVLGIPTKRGGGDLTSGDFALTAGWGNSQGSGTVMPGTGRTIDRNYSPREVVAFGAGSADLGLTREKVIELLGDRTLDVYLNANVFWSNVPLRVWEYRLGGYQVVKKWLSYREQAILGRPLRPEEIHEVTNMVRRIAAILLLTPILDVGYASAREVASWRSFSA